MGKIIFQPEELKQKFCDIFSFCIKNDMQLSLDLYSLNIAALATGDIDIKELLDRDDFKGDFIFTDDTEVLVRFPMDYENEELPFHYLYEVVKQANEGTIEDNTQFISSSLVLIHVQYDHNLLEKIDDFAYSIEQQWGDDVFSVSIVQGLTSFGIKLAMEGDYDKYYPPILRNDTFIEIQSSSKLESHTIREIVDAYIFELQSAFSLNIQPSERITGHFSESEFIDTFPTIMPSRMRPLINGKGINALIKIFNSCSKVEDYEFRILNYTKVIEYVSQTVIRKEMLDSIQRKLYSSKVLQPDAGYVLELEQLYDEHRNNKKDHQAIKLTVETCCDLTELVDIAPSFLKKFNEIKKKSENKELRSSCLEELASSITDTRNMIAHAKTNYRPKGRECPVDQLADFSLCLKVVAIQVIRWFARQHENSRII